MKRQRLTATVTLLLLGALSALSCRTPTPREAEAEFEATGILLGVDDPFATLHIHGAKVRVRLEEETLVSRDFLIWRTLGDFERIAIPEDIQPFETAFHVRGVWRHDEHGHYLQARALVTRPIPKLDYRDDPDLPRLLVLGDSISMGYHKALAEALAGKVNVHRAPENCLNTNYALGRIRSWLGDFDQPDQQWDVISFNFGHWDSAGVEEPRPQREAEYKENLERLIAILRETGARLIWVTTTPVPEPARPAGVPRNQDKSSILNRWAAEVLQRHPDIAIVDQWQIVAQTPLYRQWWTRGNIHFSPTLNPPLGRALARAVLDAVGSTQVELNPQPPWTRLEVARDKWWLHPRDYQRMIRSAVKRR